MKIPIEWIKEYISLDASDDEIASILTSIGLAVDSIEEIEGENVFDIDVTTNRPDCMNILGISRELAAATGGKLSYPIMTYKEGKSPSEDLCHVTIENANLCPRYSGKLIRGIKVSPSPSWLAKRIKQIGLRPVNNIVDLSNYVLFELGHPIHIFDFDKIKGRMIIIRNAQNGERIRTIDSTDHSLTHDMLVIADEKDPIAIAGVMGGQDSEVVSQTKDIFIESAYFLPHTVRMTSKRLGLSTDASFRFERGTDINITLKAIDRVTNLIMEISGGEASSGHIDVLKRRISDRKISLRINRMEKILGIKVSQDRAKKILKSLDMKVTPKSKGVLNVTIPSFRVDCEREIDLIEEVARFIKYDSLPCTIPYTTDQKVKETSDEREELVSHLLVSAGYSESINYSMISEKENEQFSFWKESNTLRIDNPLSERGSVLRRSLLPGLLNNISFNYSRGMKNIKLFEIGKVYAMSSRSPSEEKKHLAFIATGDENRAHWKREQRTIDFWDIKGLAEAILNELGCRYFDAKPLLEENFFLKDQSFQLQSHEEGKWAVGGQINPEITQKYKIYQPIYASEIGLDELSIPKIKSRFTPISLLPMVSRDLSIIIDEGIKFSDVERIIKEKCKETLADITLTNRYKGPPIPKGKVSLTFSIIIHQKDHTLTNEEINSLIEEVFTLLSDEYGAELRKE